MKTKWDLIGEEERASLERTPWGGRCSGCGITLATEGDFARHFLVPDERYLNLGECPNRVANGEVRRPEVHTILAPGAQWEEVNDEPQGSHEAPPSS